MAWLKNTPYKWLVAGSAFLFCANLAKGQIPQDIYRVEVKTGIVAQITSIPDAEEYNPSWAPNGKRIAHDVKGRSVPFGHSIFITHIESGVSTLLVGAEGGNDAAWSPDGEKIAFDLEPLGDQSIYLVSSKGGARKLVRTDAFQPAWAPNSKRLVFRQPSDGSIRTVDKNGGSETLVASQGEHPVWSPNGRYIAFANGGDIWKVRVNSSGIPQKPPVQVTNDPADDGQPSWDDDSEKIVFHSNHGGDYDIWIIRASGGTAKRLTGLAGHGDYDPSFSESGRYVAYSGFTAAAVPKASLAQELFSPSAFLLEQNYPNPFNPETEIRFQLPEARHVVVKIFNALGAEVRTLTDGQLEAGTHRLRWDGRDNNGHPAASGIYLYQLRAGNFSQVRRMNLVR